MKPEIKTNWLEALKSGKYTKGRGALNRRDEEFCCLGVLCQLAFEAGVVEKFPLSENTEASLLEKFKSLPQTFSYGKDKDTAKSGYLPDVVVDWAGLTDREGLLPKSMVVQNSHVSTLAALNDVTDTFEPVIEQIEKHF